MPANPAIRNRMEQVRDRKREVRTEIKNLRPLVEKYKQQFATANINGQITATKEFKDAQRASQSIAPLEAELDRLEGEEMYLLRQAAGEGAPLGNDSFLSDPMKMGELASLAESKVPIGSMNLGLAMTRDELVFDLQRRKARAEDPSSIIDYQGAGRTAPTMQGVVAPLYRQLRLLDVIPTAPMDQKVIPYVQQVPAYDTAVEVPELALKPEAATELVDAEVRAATVAHWLKTSRQALADFAGLQLALQNQLVFGVNDRVEKQIVNGNGEGDNILGVLNTTGIGSVAYDAAELAADQTLSGITTVLLSNAQPNGILLNPLDWEAMLKKKDDEGRYLSMGAFIATAQSLWNVAVIPSVAIEQGTALVGDWNRGATLYIREGVNVRLSDADQDDFLRNRITLLGEGRFGLAVWNPTCFCEVELAAPES